MPVVYKQGVILGTMGGGGGGVSNYNDLTY